MAEYQSLGPLSKAPLVYTICLIQYSSVPSIKEHAPRIMDQLRADYPELGEFEIQSWEIQLDQNSQRAVSNTRKQWKMNTADQSTGIVFDQDRVIIQTSYYEHFAAFSKRLARILNIIATEARITHTKNLGIRYIDNVKRIDDSPITELVNSSLLSPDLNDLSFSMSRQEHSYKSHEGNLFLRCYEFENQVGIPQDLLPLAEQLNKDSSSLLPIEGRFMLIDTDHVYIPSKLEELNIDYVLCKLDKLHEIASLAFRQAVTPKALELWK